MATCRTLHTPCRRSDATASNRCRHRSPVCSARAASRDVPRIQDAQFQLTVRRGYVPDPVAVSKLLSTAFAASGGEEEGEGALAGVALVRYQLKLLTALQWRASTLGTAFITVLATEAGSGQLAGVANVSPGLALADAEGHLRLGPGQAAATISNMAVAAAHRRRGLGRALLAACEEAAATGLDPPASLAALAVYRSNEAAVALYESSGYSVDDGWVDARWADSAERGRVTFARRQLMVKPLAGAGGAPGR